MPKRYTPTSAAADVEAALRLLEGRWKLVIQEAQTISASCAFCSLLAVDRPTLGWRQA